MLRVRGFIGWTRRQETRQGVKTIHKGSKGEVKYITDQKEVETPGNGKRAAEHCVRYTLRELQEPMVWHHVLVSGHLPQCRILLEFYWRYVLLDFYLK